MDWFLYDNGLRYERVKRYPTTITLDAVSFFLKYTRHVTNSGLILIVFSL